MASKLRVVSLNVRGLGDRQKRRSVFQYVRGKADIVLLQETHLDSDEKRELWQTEWGGPIRASYGDSNA